MTAVVLVIAAVWLLAAVMIGAWVGRVVRLRDEQTESEDAPTALAVARRHSVGKS